MATNVPDHTVRSVADHVRHALFPSRCAILVALTVEVGALIVHLPLSTHLLAALSVHAVIALVRWPAGCDR